MDETVYEREGWKEVEAKKTWWNSCGDLDGSCWKQGAGTVQCT